MSTTLFSNIMSNALEYANLQVENSERELAFAQANFYNAINYHEPLEDDRDDSEQVDNDESQDDEYTSHGFISQDDYESFIGK